MPHCINHNAVCQLWWKFNNNVVVKNICILFCGPGVHTCPLISVRHVVCALFREVTLPVLLSPTWPVINCHLGVWAAIFDTYFVQAPSFKCYLGAEDTGFMHCALNTYLVRWDELSPRGNYFQLILSLLRKCLPILMSVIF